MTGRISIYIAHRHTLLCDCLAIALGRQPDIAVVGVQSNAARIEERVRELGADVLLLDEALVGTDLATTIRAASATANVIVIAYGDAAELPLTCAQAGAVGFLAGPITLADLVSAIRQARRGWVAVTIERVTTADTDGREQRSDPGLAGSPARLAARERDVLRVLASGASISETADQLTLSVTEVEQHLHQSMRKLNARSKLAAVVMALRDGVLS